jgi:hypothetical protein
MIRTDAVASSRKENSHDDGGNVDACTTKAENRGEVCNTPTAIG